MGDIFIRWGYDGSEITRMVNMYSHGTKLIVETAYTSDFFFDLLEACGFSHFFADGKPFQRVFQVDDDFMDFLGTVGLFTKVVHCDLPDWYLDNIDIYTEVQP